MVVDFVSVSLLVPVAPMLCSSHRLGLTVHRTGCSRPSLGQRLLPGEDGQEGSHCLGHLQPAPVYGPSQVGINETLSG